MTWRELQAIALVALTLYPIYVRHGLMTAVVSFMVIVAAVGLVFLGFILKWAWEER